MANKIPPRKTKSNFKSGKMRRKEIRQRRIQRAKALLPPRTTSPHEWRNQIAGVPQPLGSVLADRSKLLSNSGSPIFPVYYVDKVFTCARCGVEQLWTAKQQKWWYEIIGGEIETTAIHCRPCRQALRKEKYHAKRRHYEGLIEKYGLKEAALRLSITMAELQEWRDNNIV